MKTVLYCVHANCRLWFESVCINNLSSGPQYEKAQRDATLSCKLNQWEKIQTPFISLWQWPYCPVSHPKLLPSARFFVKGSFHGLPISRCGLETACYYNLSPGGQDGGFVAESGGFWCANFWCQLPVLDLYPTCRETEVYLPNFWHPLKTLYFSSEVSCSPFDKWGIYETDQGHCRYG